MSETNKKLHAVAMMRSAQVKISEEIAGMTLEEELAWLAAQEIQDPFLKRLRERGAPQSTASGGLVLGR